MSNKTLYILTYDHGGYVLWGDKLKDRFASAIDWLDKYPSYKTGLDFEAFTFDELERIKELGLKGVKLHPDYQGFNVDDIRLKPLYKKISELGLITVFHAGFDYGFAPPYGATPEKMARALEWFSTPVVAAHWGGINCNEDVIKYLCGKDIYFDISFGYAMMPKYYAEKIMSLHTPDRMLFGTDTPWHTPDMEKRLLNTLGLSVEDMDKITHKNAGKLLGIEK